MEFPGMKRWKGRVALVTGASSGIGLSVTEKLTSYGLTVVGCARNVEPILELKAQCEKSGFKGQLHPYKCDLRKEAEIVEMFKWIKENLSSGVDVCINNAGYTTGTTLMEITALEMQDMLNTNVVALVLCSQQAVKSMISRNVVDGHIINLNSILGHTVMGIFNFYASTKFAVTALTQGFRKEFVEKGLRIKVTSISPGRTETHFLHTALGQQKADRIYSAIENMVPEDVANSILHALSAPPHVQIGEILLEPVEPSPKGLYDK